MVQKIGTCLRLLINVVKLTPGPLYVSFKVCISQHHWKLFKSLPQHAFFFGFFIFWMTQTYVYCCPFILERIKGMRLEMMISAGGQVHVGGTGTVIGIG